jgi:hypothetical protein
MWLQTQGKAKRSLAKSCGLAKPGSAVGEHNQYANNVATDDANRFQLPGNNREISGEKCSGRSRITNGSKLLLGIDGRSPWVRRCKDIIAAHPSDLGGADNTSAAERSTIRRAAVLTTELERFEVKFASAGEASTEDLDA